MTSFHIGNSRKTPCRRPYWTRGLFARTPRTTRQATAGWRPLLETLEDRLAPATLMVNSTHSRLDR
jgi:hypothetical protein